MYHQAGTCKELILGCVSTGIVMGTEPIIKKDKNSSRKTGYGRLPSCCSKQP